MGGTSVDDVQAQLAFRAACSLGEDAPGYGMGPSLLQRNLQREIEEVLRAGFERRRERLEQKVKRLVEERAHARTAGGGTATASSEPQAPRSVDLETQTDKVDEPLEGAAAKLSASVAAVLGGDADGVQPSVRSFGPSETQVKFSDPPEKRDDAVPEAYALKVTLESLERAVSKREGQILSLTQQFEACREMSEETAAEAEALSKVLNTLLSQPEHLEGAHSEKIRRRERRIEELTEMLEAAQGQTRKYQSLVVQQRTFFLQSKRLMASGGRMALARHAAGDVFLVPPPDEMIEDATNTFDVGNAIANPYVCDSWPFEPNVLATRRGAEATMETFDEETDDILSDGQLPPHDDDNEGDNDDSPRKASSVKSW
eukprot:NODE_729_length_1389_cov_456.148426.p1 GENE.NODE_729_length_1389_cov_456.148426~~NODE_729_length_1389_cov_456.148426.p1  ORF type:complete len:387 (+),score=96.06 NODE_729_length_1389_cov_456.148426:48-1163(+)